jgi:hypothetical protein
MCGSKRSRSAQITIDGVRYEHDVINWNPTTLVRFAPLALRLPLSIGAPWHEGPWARAAHNR